MPELALLVVGLGVLGAIVLLPVLRARADRQLPDDERDAAELRHRVALEALRDVEADRRAGSLDEASYADQLAEAEVRAAETRGALDRPSAGPAPARRPVRRAAVLAAVAIGALLLAGWLAPPTGIANQTVTNEALAAAQAAEEAREVRIGELLDALVEDPDDAEALSNLADAYLAGSTSEDLSRAVVTLQALRSIEPERADVYERIISAYLRAGDGVNARAALDSYRGIAAADPVEVAFLDGLIALRTERDPDAAIAAFERFLELAPDDERAGMVRTLRDEADDAR
jgi:cytochrome c-type biogenesis protein CcmH/NrfG